MTGAEMVDEIAEMNEEALFYGEFEEALIGYVEVAAQPLRPVYDRSKCIEILMAQGLSDDDAVEMIQSIMSAWHGPGTPAFITLLANEDVR